MDIFMGYTHSSNIGGTKVWMNKPLINKTVPFNFVHKGESLCTDCSYLKSLYLTDVLEFICAEMNFCYWNRKKKKSRCLKATSSGTKVVKREFLQVKLILLKFLVAFLENFVSFTEWLNLLCRNLQSIFSCHWINRFHMRSNLHIPAKNVIHYF